MEKYFDSRLNPEFRHGASDVWRLVSADILSRLPGEANRVLDLGAGYGDFINQVKAKERWAVDIWAGFASHLNPGVQGVLGDIKESLPGIPEKHFDLCFMSNVLEHFTIEEGKDILKNAIRCTRKDGFLALLQPNFTYCAKNYFDDYTHKTIYTAAGLCDFLSDHGYTVLKCHPRYLPFSFKSRLPRPLWAVQLYLKSPWKPLAAQMLILARKNS